MTKLRFFSFKTEKKFNIKLKFLFKTEFFSGLYKFYGPANGYMSWMCVDRGNPGLMHIHNIRFVCIWMNKVTVCNTKLVYVIDHVTLAYAFGLFYCRNKQHHRHFLACPFGFSLTTKWYLRGSLVIVPISAILLWLIS
jgi:hypothetical protein